LRLRDERTDILPQRATDEAELARDVAAIEANAGGSSAAQRLGALTTTALDQISTLTATPELRREQIKFQVDLVKITILCTIWRVGSEPYRI
jgi:hypothetical protein